MTGTIGDHGISIISYREGFKFGTELMSDVAPIWKTIEAALKVGGITAMKDPTRGGVANVLNEMAAKSHVKIYIDEETLPIRRDVKAAADMLGIDPMEVANEGKAVMGVEADKAEELLQGDPGHEVRQERRHHRRSRRRQRRHHAHEDRRTALHRAPTRRPGPASLLDAGYSAPFYYFEFQFVTRSTQI